MAKALIGHLSHDQRVPARLAAENRRLRERVLELEELVGRLKDENDSLVESRRAGTLGRERKEPSELQPV